jgi:uncharacterized membrane protein YsdA (DUF1294 family)
MARMIDVLLQADPWMLAIAVLLLLTNLLAFIQFGADKRRALTQDQRIPEQNLLMMAFLGGYFGAKAGQYLFRHKTRKQRLWPPSEPQRLGGALPDRSDGRACRAPRGL